MSTDERSTYFRQFAALLMAEMDKHDFLWLGVGDEEKLAVLLAERAYDLMAEALPFVRLVAEEWYVRGEMWHECFFCSSVEMDEDEYHRVNCPVLAAQAWLARLSKSHNLSHQENN